MDYLSVAFDSSAASSLPTIFCGAPEDMKRFDLQGKNTRRSVVWIAKRLG